MNITCPQCGFSRQMNPDRVPAESVIATCPKCSCKFRFHKSTGLTESLPPQGRAVEAAAHGEPEEDIRIVAKRAYENEANRFKNEEAARKREEARNPWDAAPDEKGWITAFYQTVTRVMFSAPEFFAHLSSVARQTRPLCFFLIICVFQTVVENIWSQVFQNLFAPVAAGDPQMEKLLEMLAGQQNLPLSILLRAGISALQLYLFAFLMFMVYRALKPERASFSLIFQILAYSYAPTLLCIVPALGSLAGLIWGIGCLAIGCKSALNLSWARTLAGFLPLAALFAPFLFQALELVRQ